uniref:ARF7 effector protein C-terminal domain-containing protein n=1 Tax=Glossina palpalis gambiensis TaxID=67801 RepID=A0A1B0BBA9_9MUSC
MDCNRIRSSSSAESIGSNISSEPIFVAIRLEDADNEFEIMRRESRKRELCRKKSLKIPCKDICDCTRPKCPGCWSECIKCGSNKCGLECRINRKKSCNNFAYVDSFTYRIIKKRDLRIFYSKRNASMTKQQRSGKLSPLYGKPQNEILYIYP